MINFKIAFITIISLAVVHADELPKELSSLKKIRDEKMLNLDKQYLIAIERVKINFTKAGDLESAIKADEMYKEIDASIKQRSKSIVSNKPNVTTKNNIVNDYTTSYKAFGDLLTVKRRGEVFQFYKKGIVNSETIRVSKPYPKDVPRGSILKNYLAKGGDEYFGKGIMLEKSIFSKHFIIHFCEKSILVWDYKLKKFDSIMLKKSL